MVSFDVGSLFTNIPLDETAMLILMDLLRYYHTLGGKFFVSMCKVVVNVSGSPYMNDIT